MEKEIKNQKTKKSCYNCNNSQMSKDGTDVICELTFFVRRCLNNDYEYWQPKKELNNEK